MKDITVDLQVTITFCTPNACTHGEMADLGGPMEMAKLLVHEEGIGAFVDNNNTSLIREAKATWRLRE